MIILEASERALLEEIKTGIGTGVEAEIDEIVAKAEAEAETEEIVAEKEVTVEIGTKIVSVVLPQEAHLLQPRLPLAILHLQVRILGMDLEAAMEAVVATLEVATGAVAFLKLWARIFKNHTGI